MLKILLFVKWSDKHRQACTADFYRKISVHNFLPKKGENNRGYFTTSGVGGKYRENGGYLHDLLILQEAFHS